MPLRDLTPGEQDLIHACLKAAVDGPFFDEPEFHTLFGLYRSEVEAVVQRWPVDDEHDEDARLAINNAFAMLLSYSHGYHGRWEAWIDADRAELDRVFWKWRGTAPTPST